MFRPSAFSANSTPALSRYARTVAVPSAIDEITARLDVLEASRPKPAPKSAATIKAEMLAQSNAPVAKQVQFSQTVEVAGVQHDVGDSYQWLRGKAWPQLVEDEDIISHLEHENDYCKVLAISNIYGLLLT